MNRRSYDVKRAEMKAIFTDISWNEEERTFKGVIQIDPPSSETDAASIFTYRLTFDYDYKEMIAADKEWQDSEGNVLKTASIVDMFTRYTPKDGEGFIDRDGDGIDDRTQDDKDKDDFDDLMDEVECPDYSKKISREECEPATCTENERATKEGDCLPCDDYQKG